MTRATDKPPSSSSTGSPRGPIALAITVMSFGYKAGAPPAANALFDVRFLKNPYWIDELRHLNGRDQPVQDYVMEQAAAADFLESITGMVCAMVPRLKEQRVSEFSIAFGCTGGQHRSTTLAELLSTRLRQEFPEVIVTTIHRELASDLTTNPPGGQPL